MKICYIETKKIFSWIYYLLNPYDPIPNPFPSCPPLRFGRRRGEGRPAAQATAVDGAVASSPSRGS